jgi:Flp pilus assembly protein TadG
MRFPPSGGSRRPAHCRILPRVKAPRRSGAAIVEFAIMAPVLFAMILGMIEIGRAMMVTDLLNSAARNGARTAVLQGSDNTMVTTTVNDSLTGTGVSGASTTILVNGTAADVSTAAVGDAVTVSVNVPFRNVTWLPVSLFMAENATLGGRVVMRREG